MTVRDEEKQNWTEPRIFDVFLNFVKRIRPTLNSGCA